MSFKTGLGPDKSDQEFKADDGKPRPTLLETGCTRALRAVQATLDYGERKYEAHSWQKVPGGQQRYDDAARRHRIARDMGQTHDDESGLMHLSHEIICNLFLLELMITGDPGMLYMDFRDPPQEHKITGVGVDKPHPSTRRTDYSESTISEEYGE
jgi:hypothetical protein